MSINFKQLSVNYSILFIAEAFSKLFGFIAFAYIARTFGPNYYGYLEFTIAVVFIFNLIVDSGFWKLGVREVAKDEKLTDQYVTHIVFIQYVLAIFSYCLIGVFVYFIQKPLLVKKLILLYGLTLFGTPLLLHWVFQARNKTWLVAITSIIRQVGFAVAVIIFIRNRDQIWQVPFFEIASFSMVIFFNVFVFIRYFGSFLFKINVSFVYQLLLQVLPIGMSHLLWALRVYLAIILLGILVSSEEVGWFGVGHRLVISLHMFVYLYYYNLLPHISRCAQQPIIMLQNLLGTSIKITVWIAVFIGMSGTLLAKRGIFLIYGYEYTESILPFQIMVWVLALTLLSGHYRFTLIGYGKQKYELYSSAWGTGLNVTLNLLLIPIMGLVGAAISFLASEIIIWYVSYYYVNSKISKIPMCTKLVKPITGGLIMGTSLYFLPFISLWATGCAAIAIYIVTMYLFQPSLVRNVRSIFSSI